MRHTPSDVHRAMGKGDAHTGHTHCTKAALPHATSADKKSRARVTCVYAAGFSSSSAEAMPAEYEKDPNFLLTVHGYVMGMRRVKGDDGDKDQILRYIIADKEKVTWDVYRVIEPDKTDVWVSRPFDEGEIAEDASAPTDLMDYKASFDKCSPGGPTAASLGQAA